LSGRRRTIRAVEAELRGREQRAQVGREIRAARLRRGWTQAQLATRAGVGRQVIGRLERAVTRLDVDVLQRIGLAFGRRLEITYGRDPTELTADAGHLAVQELILRVGRDAGYSGTFELATRPSEPWRSVDVVLASPSKRTMLLVECWNTFGDLGAATRSTTRKLAEAEDLAAARWGADGTIGSVWVIRATARNRALVARYPEVFASRFPGSSRAWLEALTNGAQPPPRPGLVWADVGATRLFEWRRSVALKEPARPDRPGRGSSPSGSSR
jgi:transcriptional regulator with XRE-family HTH domain